LNKEGDLMTRVGGRFGLLCVGIVGGFVALGAPCGAFGDWRAVTDGVRVGVEELQPPLGPHQIGIEYRAGGEIRLEGSVADEASRRRVEEVAAKTAGVHSVDNRLIVAKSGAAPRDLSEEVARINDAIRKEVTGRWYSISIREHGGDIVINGKTDSVETQKDILRVASSVSKKHIVDEMMIKEGFTDAEVTASIKRTLDREYPTLVKGLDVHVKDGVAHLSGNLPTRNDVDKTLATVLMVDGVRDVESSVKAGGHRYGEVHPKH
jgi:osmotically-inducible protein OsmY